MQEGRLGIVTNIVGRNINRLKKRGNSEKKKEKIEKSEKGGFFSSWKRRVMVQSGVSETGKAGSAYQVNFGG